MDDFPYKNKPSASQQNNKPRKKLKMVQYSEAGVGTHDKPDYLSSGALSKKRTMGYQKDSDQDWANSKLYKQILYEISSDGPAEPNVLVGGSDESFTEMEAGYMASLIKQKSIIAEQP